MKKILVLLLLIITIFCFSGCTERSSDYKEYSNDRFMVVESYRNYRILVDKETRICYLENNEIYQGGITIMLDYDGKPLLYEGNLD